MPVAGVHAAMAHSEQDRGDMFSGHSPIRIELAVTNAVYDPVLRGTD